MEQTIETEEFENSKRLVKQLIWTYFWLLIFEGALRKWVLPGLSAPLLIIRDPIAILIFFTARNRGFMPSNSHLLGMSIVGILAIFTSLVSGHGNIFVSLYGARPYLIHFPMIFIMGKVFDRKDVIQMGKMILWISIPMAILIGLQFYSPQSAWVNRGVGGDEAGGGFAGALGYYRPPGTFSFTTGNVQFFSLVGVFVCYFWLSQSGINIVLLFASTAALLASIPFSISRSLFFQILLTFLFVIMGGVRKPKHILRIAIAMVGVIGIFLLVSNSNVYQTATEVLFARFDNASASEGGIEGTLLDRFFGGIFGVLTNLQDWPLFGYGLGVGTNVASMLLRGYVDFTVGEDEWSRIIGELGPPLGLAIVFFRIRFTVVLILNGFKELLKNDFLPWTLMSFGILTIAYGNWAQPTSLGFSTIIAGLTLASLEDPIKTDSEESF